jgi:hypothetical protein
MCFHASLSQMIQGRVAFGGRISTAKAREKHKHWKSNVLLIQADGVQGFSCKVVSCFFIHLVMIPTQFGGRVWFTNVHQQECAALLHPIILCVPYLIILGDLVARHQHSQPSWFCRYGTCLQKCPFVNRLWIPEFCEHVAGNPKFGQNHGVLICF